MSERFVLNETSYFGRGSRSELANEIKRRNYRRNEKFIGLFFAGNTRM